LLNFACFALLLGQLETVESPPFSKELQTNAVLATVRVVNLSRDSEGSGVILGRKGAFVYVLTADHVVEKADHLEVATFSASSYPKPRKVYRSVRVVARAGDTRDLALLRLVTDDPMPGSLSLCPARLVPRRKRFKALTVGCGEGEAPTCQVDEVTGKKLVRRHPGGKAASMWEVAGKQLEGRSGGPVVDKRGSLLGVCSGTNKEKSYFCHVEEVRAFLRGSGFDWLI